MIKKIAVSICIISISLFYFTQNNAVSHPTGAPDAHTGSPHDVVTCTECHLGPPASPLPNIITSNVPATGYVPGNTYTITAQFPRPGHTTFGFQISPQDNAGSVLGTLVNTTPETQITGLGTYITHTIAGTTGTDSKMWTFNWIAPASGTGTVNFYGAFNATDGDLASFDDSVFTSVYAVMQNPQSVNEFEKAANNQISIFPNPVTDYFTLKFNNLEGNMKLTLYNLQGKKCFEKNGIMVSKTDVSKTINFTEQMHPGNYIMDVSVGKHTFSKTIIIQ